MENGNVAEKQHSFGNKVRRNNNPDVGEVIGDYNA
jgi:hypothetical protein